MIDRIIDAAVRALNWWVDGLWRGFPARLRDRSFRTRDHVWIRLSGNDATVESSATCRETSEKRVNVTLNDPKGAETIRGGLEIAEDADVTVVLPRPVALTKQLVLPPAAESALRDVLCHELDRLTPFATEDIVFDYHVRERATDKIVVEIALARRDALESILASLERLALRPTAVTMEDAAGRLLPVNLREQRPRLRLPFGTVPVRPAVAISAGLALLTVLYLPLLRYDALLVRYEEAVAAVREDAVTARAELETQEAALERTDFLNRRRSEYVAPLELLLELTERLPEHTWIARASFAAREVQLQGESTAASELLQVVESAERLKDARFQAPVSRSNESGKEQFTIVASPTGAASRTGAVTP